jgi:hypothetical protein
MNNFRSLWLTSHRKQLTRLLFFCLITLITFSGFLFTTSSSSKAKEQAGKFRRVKNSVLGQYIVVFKDAEVSASEVKNVANDLVKKKRGEPQNYLAISLKGFFGCKNI